MFLNTLYTLFDFLVDQNQVYKVETIGDAYLIVSGCPTKATNHALKICDMAFDMMDGIKMLKDPGTEKDVEMRIGCHSGPVVAGIVGLKMPRYIRVMIIFQFVIYTQGEVAQHIWSAFLKKKWMSYIQFWCWLL